MNWGWIMYLHKENRELFRDAILLTSQKLEVSEDIVEKDYYVTLILKKLSSIEYPVVFKGGTSLSKAFQVIDRFSEDIDITFTEHLGEARRKKLKYSIPQPLAAIKQKRIILFVVACAIMHLITVSTYHSIGN